MMKARLAAAFLALACGPALRAAEPAASPEFFENKVRPVLVEHCVKCHGDAKGKEPKGGLRVDSRAALLKGGDNGPALVVGDPVKSKIIEAIGYANADMQMPPKGKLSDAVIADLTAWVKAGAVWPGEAAGPATSIATFDLGKRKKDHWAWQPVRAPETPAVRDAKWPLSAVDRFILAKLETNKLRPAAPAERRVWIRRVTFDLTGLPPTPAEIDAYLVDKSVDAERVVVERLLASPHFGERWGRHWLDLVRYAETRGHEFDPLLPNAYQYRDYVIRALNADVPYDRFVQEQIAGDLLGSPRLNPNDGFNESVLGTGFWFLNEEVHSPVDIRQDQADRFDNRIDVLTKTFCALTVSCARCHDHKFDAISTRDYYALYGIIEGSSYRQVRFDTLERDRRVGRKLDELNARSARALAAALLGKPLASYLLAAKAAIRTGVDLRTEAAGDVVFEDFESGTYANWEVTGTAFGDKPHTLATIAPYQGKINANGKYFVNSHNIRNGGDTARGDAHVGTMTSKSFVVSHKYITMLVGGGSHATKTCVNLVMDGKIVRSAAGRDNNQMFPVRWDVADLKGKAARIQIVDDATGPWGNIGVDDIVFTDSSANGDRPKEPRASEFSEAFRERIAEAARQHNLDAPALTAWVEHLLRATKEPADPFHLWATLAADKKYDDPKTLANFIAALQAVKAPSLPAGTQIVIDYATSRPDQWLPDDASFGTRPQRIGDLVVDGDRVRFADQAAAVFDRLWSDTAVPPKTEMDHGVIGSRVRSGRSIRTPVFQVAGKLHYLVKGGGMAFAAVDGHTLVAGPLHGSLVMEFPNSSGYRWVTHDLSAYQGHHVHVEFTAGKDQNFAVAMVAQGPQPPAPPGTPSYIPEKATLAEEIAAGYQREIAAALEQLANGRPVSAKGAGLANVVVRLADAREASQATTAYLAGRERLAKETQKASRLAPAAWEGSAVEERVFIRGSPKGLGEPVPRRFLEALAGNGPMTTAPGSGRLALAKTITDPTTNPFIARVMVNRVWHHLFGRGLVASVDNFGVLGEAPTHPELLDFLADRFVRDGWSLKNLIRDLVLSSTYRMSTFGDPESDKADVQTLLVHRTRIRRLEGEAIRDAMLAVSGRLDRTPYGPPIPVHLTPFLEGRGKPGVSGPLDGDGRRSIYQSVRRNFLNPFFLAFDTPIPFSTVGRRQVSNVPAQALILLNDPFVQQQAALWAKEVLARPLMPPERIHSMYLTAFGRAPTNDESAACLEFIDEQAKRHGTKQNELKPWADLAHTLFNMKEFIYLD
jgi:cytochrome c553